MIKQLISFTKGYKKILFASFLFGLFGFFAHTGLIYKAFDFIINNNLGKYGAWPLVLLALALGVSRYLEQYLGHLVAFKLLSQLRNQVYKKLRTLAPSKLDHAQSGNLLTLINTDIELVEVFFAHTLVPVSLAIVYSIIIVLVLVSMVGIKALFVGLAYLVVGALLPFYKKDTITEKNRKIQEYKSGVRQKTIEIISGQRELKQLFKFQEKLSILDKDMDEEIKLTKKVDLLVLNKLTYTAISIFVFTTLWYLMLRPDIETNPKLILLVLTLPLSFDPLLAMANLSTSLNKTLISAKNLLTFLNEEPMIKSGSCEIKGNIEKIEFKNALFKYPNSDRLIFEGLNLSVEEGQTIGISGPSGIGKSSIVKLIMRWYDLNEGQLLINGIDIREYDLVSLRGQMNYLPQEPFIFNASIKDNIKLTSPITDEVINDWLVKLDLSEKIDNLENGLDTLVSKESPLLSSGEWQRLELMRAILHESSLLILDEPTSNLDAGNEELLIDLVDKYYGGTTIIISHNKQSFNRCHKVYNFEDLVK